LGSKPWPGTPCHPKPLLRGSGAPEDCQFCPSRHRHRRSRSHHAKEEPSWPKERAEAPRAGRFTKANGTRPLRSRRPRNGNRSARTSPAIEAAAKELRVWSAATGIRPDGNTGLELTVNGRARRPAASARTARPVHGPARSSVY